MKRLTILLAAMVAGALLVAPAAHAATGTSKVHVKLTGTGSGKAYIDPGLEHYRGSPEIKCTYASPGPQAGTCDTAMSAEGEGWEQVLIVFEASAGSKLTSVTTNDPEVEACGLFPESKTKGVCTPYVEPELELEEEFEVVATFELEPLSEFALTVVPAGAGSGTVTSSPAGINCGSECSAEFTEGTTVTLTGAPAVGSKPVSWLGCGSVNGENKCLVTMSAAKEVTATFDLEPPLSEFALTVVPAGAGSGTVTSSPAGINCGVDCSEAYAAGTEVTLTATAASGSTFSGWSGDCTGTAVCKVTMSQARGVTATFAKEPTLPPPGTVSVGPTAKVKSGKALLKLTCNGEGPCKGSLKLTAKIKSGGKTKTKTIGKGSFSLAAGAKTTLKVKLSAPAKQAVAKKPLKAKVSGSGVRSSTVKLKK